jgi:hypothetical protein
MTAVADERFDFADDRLRRHFDFVHSVDCGRAVAAKGAYS